MVVVRHHPGPQYSNLSKYLYRTQEDHVDSVNNRNWQLISNNYVVPRQIETEERVFSCTHPSRSTQTGSNRPLLQIPFYISIAPTLSLVEMKSV
jgi:hypothetical protein